MSGRLVISKAEYFWCAYFYLVEGYWEERQRQFNRDIMNFHGDAVMKMTERRSPIYDLLEKRCTGSSLMPALLVRQETPVEKHSLGPVVFDEMVWWSEPPMD